jgi:hypothetical protein
VPSSVVVAAVASARKSVFQATPQRTPPARHERPKVRSCASRSANVAGERCRASSKNALASAFVTG